MVKLELENITLMGLENGAYLANSEGKIITDEISLDGMSTRLLTFMLSSQDERKGIAFYYYKKICILAPLRYIGAGRSKRTNEGTGIYITTPNKNEMIKISELFSEAFTNIKESIMEFGGEFIEFYPSVINCSDYLKNNTGIENAWGGNLLYKYAIGEKVEIKIDGLIALNYLMKNGESFCLFICEKYLPTSIDFNIIAMTENIKNLPETKKWLDLYKFIKNTDYSDNNLKNIMGYSLKKLNINKKFSEEFINYCQKYNQEDILIKEYTNKKISGTDLPLHLKIKSKNVICPNDIISYLKEENPNHGIIINSFECVSVELIIQTVEEMININNHITKEVIDLFLKKGLDEGLETKHFALLEFTEDNELYQNIINKYVKSITEKFFECFVVYNLWDGNKNDLEKSILKNIKKRNVQSEYSLKEKVLFIIPLLLPIITYFIFQNLGVFLGNEAEYYSDYIFYWLFWCLLFSLWVSGKSIFSNLFFKWNSQNLSKKMLFLLIVPPLGGFLSAHFLLDINPTIAIIPLSIALIILILWLYYNK